MVAGGDEGGDGSGGSHGPKGSAGGAVEGKRQAQVATPHSIDEGVGPHAAKRRKVGPTAVQVRPLTALMRVSFHDGVTVLPDNMQPQRSPTALTTLQPMPVAAQEAAGCSARPAAKPGRQPTTGSDEGEHNLQQPGLRTG